MAIDGLLAQEEFVRNGLVGLACRDEPEHLLLPRAEAMGVWRGTGISACARGCAHRLDCRYIWSGAKMNEGLLRGVELERSAVLVAERLKRASHKETDARAQVRSPDALPHVLSVA